MSSDCSRACDRSASSTLLPIILIPMHPPIRRDIALLRVGLIHMHGRRRAGVHISAVEKAGYSSLQEGAKVSFDVVSNRGKESAENLKIR
jgi:cold shock CspA family protein